MKFCLASLLTSAVVTSQVSAQDLDIPTTAVNAGAFETLVAALGAADLVGVLSEPGPFTVFAPTDDAFDELPEDLVTCLLEPDNVDALTSILAYHVVAGTVLSTDLMDGMMAETLNTEDITIDLSDGVVINNSSEVVIPDVLATNGVIHVIDSGKKVSIIVCPMMLVFFIVSLISRFPQFSYLPVST